MTTTDGPGTLRQHDFRRVYLANAVSLLGSRVTILAMPLVAINVMHASPFEVGALTACSTAAFLLVGLPAGAWVDRWRRRPVLIATDLARAVVLGSVPAAWAMHALSMAQLYVVALVAGVLSVFFEVAYQSYLPHLVDRSRLVEANAQLETVRSVTQIAGPGIAGALVQAVTAPFAILFDAASFLGSAALLTGIRREEQPVPAAAKRSLRHEILEGLRFVFGDRMLRAIAACTGWFNLCLSASMAMLTVLLARDLKLPAGAIGLFFSTVGVGAFIGATTAKRAVARIGGRIIRYSATAAGAALLLVPLADRDWRLGLAALGFGLSTAAQVIYNVAQVSFRQAHTPQHLLGRMNATMRFIVWGTMPLGGLIGGALGATIGARATLWLTAAGATLAFVPLLTTERGSERTTGAVGREQVDAGLPDREDATEKGHEDTLVDVEQE